jgi:hypothetical protein
MAIGQWLHGAGEVGRTYVAIVVHKDLPACMAFEHVAVLGAYHRAYVSHATQIRVCPLFV